MSRIHPIRILRTCQEKLREQLRDFDEQKAVAIERAFCLLAEEEPEGAGRRQKAARSKQKEPNRSPKETNQN